MPPGRMHEYGFAHQGGAMKSKTKLFTVMITLFAMPVTGCELAAQDEAEPRTQTHYVVKILNLLGGTQGGANGVTNGGLVTGWSNLTGDQSEHGLLWRGQSITDLGTLGGPNSAVSFPVKDDKGVIAGNSQTSETDPFGENFCTSSTYTTYLGKGFLGQNGQKTAPPTLGGNNSGETVVNHRGQVAGFAETGTQDPGCIAPQVFDFKAVVWWPNEGQMHEFPPLPGDAISAALGINDRSEVVGGSGTCGTPSTSILVHAVLWQFGSTRDLGSLGGVTNNLAAFINNRSEVVGTSDLSGDTTFHAFLWTSENGMKDLETLPGDSFSSAESINEEGQVVGESCDQNGNCRAFIWQDGVMTDLNSLVLPGSALYLVNISDINDRGEVAGYAYDPNTGEGPGFLAIPCDAQHAEVEDCMSRADRTIAADHETGTHPKITLPENVRQVLQRRIRFQRH